MANKKKDDSLFSVLFGTMDAMFDGLDDKISQVFGFHKPARSKKLQPDIRVTLTAEHLAVLQAGGKLKYTVSSRDLEIEVCLKS